MDIVEFFPSDSSASTDGQVLFFGPFTRQNTAAELHTLNESCYIPKFPMLRASLFSDCLMGHAGSSAGNSVFMDMRTLSVGFFFFFMISLSSLGS